MLRALANPLLVTKKLIRFAAGGSVATFGAVISARLTADRCFSPSNAEAILQLPRRAAPAKR